MLDLILIAAMTSSSLSPGLLSSASAQSTPVATPPLQVANGRTSLDVTPAGTPIVNIAAPDKNGTSYNLYTTLSAGPEGLIFNNSPATGQSTVGGFLLANPNIVGKQSAGLILNEVTGGVRSSLAGPIEIFGRQAALVIANPTGITCDGCGFINTSRVSLAAANLQFAADGTFSGFRTSGGDVTIEGKGLLAGNVDYFDIIASVAHINADFYAKDLTVAGGSGTYDYASRTANAGGSGPSIAIDSSLLGGMYANRIRLIGNGTGVGVNLAGTVAALDGPLTITADGAIALAKVASSGDATVTSTSGAVTLGDQAYAAGSLDVSAGQSIHQTGGFAGALGTVRFAAADAVSLGGTGAYAGLDADGNLTRNSDLTIRGSAIDAGNAALAAGGAIAIKGASFSTGAASQIGGNGLSIDVLGAIDARGAIQSSSDAALQADRIDVTGTLGASGALALSGRQIILAGTATGLASATAAASESFSITPAGAFQTNGLAQISAPVLANAGTILGNNVRLDAASFVQTGNLGSVGDLDVAVRGDATLDGLTQAGGEASLVVDGKAAVTGQLAAAKAVSLSASDLTVQGTVQTGGTLTLTSMGNLAAGTTAEIAADGAANLVAANALMLDGLVGSDQALTLAGKTVDLTGSAQAMGNLALTAQTLSLSGSLLSGDDLVATVDRSADLTGTLSAAGALTLTAADLTTGTTAQVLSGKAMKLAATSGAMTHAGTMSAGGDVAVSAADALELNGMVAADGLLTISGPSVALGGQTLGMAGVAIAGRAVMFGASSDLQSGGVLTINAGDELSTQGRIVSLGAVSLTSDGRLRQAASITGNGAVTLGAATDLIQTGTISAGGPVHLAAAAIDNSGAVLTNDTLELTASTSLISSGDLMAGGALTLTAPRLTLGGTTATNAVLGLHASSVTISGAASGLAGVATTIDDLALTAEGALQSGSGLMLDLASIDNAGLISSTGTLRIGSTGTFANSGQIVSEDALTLDARGDLVSSGLLQAGADLAATVAGRAQIAGTLYSVGDTHLAAANLSAAGSLSAGNALTLAIGGDADLADTSTTYAKTGLSITAADLTAAGALQSDGTLALTAAQALALGGTAQAGGATSLGAGSGATLSGTLASGGALSLTAPEIAVSGQILANDSVDLTANAQNLSLTGTIQAGKDVALTALKRLTIGAPSTSGSTGSGSSGSGSNPGSTGSAGSSGGSGSASGSNGGSGSGSGDTTSSLTLDVPQLADSSSATGTTLALPGTLAANGSVVLTAEDIDVYGLVSAKGDLSALASHVLTIKGSVWADGKLTADLGGLSLGSAGTLASDGALKLTALTDIANLGTIASNLADVTLSYAGAFTNAGTVFAKGAYTVDTAADYAAAGTVSAGTVSIAARDITLAGTLIGASSLGLSGRTLTLGAGSDVETGGVLSLSATRDLSLAGKLLGNAATLRADGALSLRGSADLQAGGVLSLTALGDLSSAAGSSIVADKGLLFSGASLSLNGNATSNAALNLTSTSAGGTAIGGQLTALGDVVANLSGTFNLTGALAGAGKLTLAAGATTLGVDSTLQAGGTLSLTTASLVSAGVMQGVKGVTVSSAGGATYTGTLIAGTVDATSGAVTSLADLSLSATGLLDLDGDVSATGNGTLTAGTLAASQLTVRGNLVTLGNLDMTAATLGTSGIVQANGSLTARGTQGVTLAGTLSGLTGLAVTSGGSLIQGATIGSNGTLTLDAAGALTHTGTTMTAGAIALTGGTLTFGGTVGGDDALSLTSTAGAVQVLSGAVLSAGDVTLTSATDANVAGTIVGTTRLTVGAGETLSVASTGTLQAGTFDDEGNANSLGQMSLGAGASIVNAGTVIAGGDLDLVAQSLSLGGIITSNGSFSASTTAGALVVSGGLEGRNLTLAAAGGDLSLANTSYLTAYGTGSDGLLSLAGNHAINVLGSISANGDVAVSAAGNLTIGADQNETYALASAGNVTITSGGALTNLGKVQAGGALALTGASLSSNNLLAGGTLTATTFGDITFTGATYGASGASITSSAGSIALSGNATMQSPGAIEWAAAGSITSAGSISAGGPVHLAAAAIDNSGAVLTNDALDLTASAALISSGDLMAGGALTLTASRLTLGGTTATNAVLGLHASSVTISGAASGLTGVATTIDDLTLTADGALQSGSGQSGAGLTLDLASLDNAGLISSIGALRIGSAGTFANSGQIVSEDALTLDARGDLVSSGLLQAGADLAATVAGRAQIAGTFYSEGDTHLSAASLSAAGSLYVGDALALAISGDADLAESSATYAKTGLSITAADLTAAGALQSDGALSLTATQALALGGTAQAGGATSLGAGRSATLSGTLASGGALSLAAPEIAVSGQILANDTVDLTANAQNLSLTGTIQAGKDVALTALKRLTIGAPSTSGSTGSGSSGSGSNSGSSGGAGSSGSGGSGSGSNSGSGSGSGGTTSSLTLDVPQLADSSSATGTTLALPGTLAANGSVVLTAEDIDVYGLVSAKGDLSALASHVLTVEGSVWADGKLTADLGGLSLGTAGTLASDGALKLTALTDIANLGTIASNLADVTLSYAGVFTNAGTVFARGAYTVDTAADYAAAGTVSAGTVSIAARDITLAGTLIGASSLDLSGRTLTLGAGSDVETGGALSLTAIRDLSLAGKLLGNAATLSADGGLSLLGSADLQAGGVLSLTALGDLSSAAGSSIVADKGLIFSAASLSLNGDAMSNAALNLTSTNGTAISGQLTALGDVVANLSGTFDLNGVLAGAGKLTLAAGATTLGVDSTLQANDTLSLTTASLVSAGVMQGVKGVTVTSAGGATYTGTLIVGTVDASSGAVTSLADLSLSATGLLDLDGDVSATGNGTLTAGTLAASQLTVRGNLVTLGNLDMTAATLGTSGIVQANGLLTAHGTQGVTLAGTLSGLSGLAVTSGGSLLQGATIGSNGALTLDAAGTLTHTGTTTAVGAIGFKGGTLTLGGTVSGNGTLVLTSTAGAAQITGGAVLSASDVTLTSATDANVAGALVGTTRLATNVAGTLSLSSTGMLQAGTADDDGNVTSLGQMTLGAGTAISNAGLMSSTGGIAFNSPSFANTGTVSTGEDINLVAQSLSLGGIFISRGNISARTTAGALIVSGGLEGRNLTLTATGGDLTLGSASYLTAYGTGSDGLLSLTGSGAINALGVIAANSDISLNAAQGISIGADRDTAYALSTAGKVTINAGAALSNLGTVQAGGTLTLSSASLSSRNLLAGDALTVTTSSDIALSGTTYGQNGASLVTTGGALSLGSGANVQSRGALTLRAAGDLTNNGAISAGVDGASTLLGTINLTSGGALRSTGAIVSNNDAITLTGSSITLGGKLADNGGTYAARGLTLGASTVTVLGGGEVVSNQALAYNGANLTLGSGALLQSNASMTLALSGAYQSAGNLVSLGDLSLSATGALTNLAGSGIYAGGSGTGRAGGTLSLWAATIDNAGQIVATSREDGSKGTAVLTAGTITATGLIHADNGLGLSTANLTINGAAATVESGAALSLDIPNLTLANGGTLKSASGLTVTATSLANQGAMLAGGDLSVSARSSFTSSGTLGAARSVTLHSDAGMTLNGVVSSDDAGLSVTASGALSLGANANLYGKTGLTAVADSIGVSAPANSAIVALASHGDIGLTSIHGLTLGGAIIADGSVSLTDSSGLTLTADSLVSAGTPQATPSITGSGITLTGPAVSSLGTLAATGGLAFNTSALTVGGIAVANGNLTLASFQGGAAPTLTVNQGGTLASYLGNANLGALSGLTLAGSLIATSGDVSLYTPSATITATGVMGAGRNLSLTGGTLDLAAGGQITAGNDLSITLTGSRAGEWVAVDGVSYDLTGTPISATILGKLSAGHDLLLSMPGALVVGGTAQLIASNDMTIGASQAVIGARYTADGAGQPLTLGVIAGRDLRLTGGLTLDGSMQAGRDLTVTANGARVTSTAAAQFVAGNALSLSGASLALAGVNSGERSVSFSALGDVTLSGATASNGRVALAANTATVTESGSITTYGGSANTTSVGRNIGASANIDLTTSGDLTNNGAIWSDGVVFLKSASGNVINNAAGANGGITGLTVITQADSGSFLNQAGAFKAANAGLFLTGDFNNTGSFAPSGNYWISAANIINSGLIGTSGDLTLNAVGNITNTGTIYSGRNLTLTAGGALTNDYLGDDQGNGQHGLILAQGNIAVTAHDVINRSATIQSLGGSIGIDLTGGSLTNEIKAFSFTPDVRRIKVCLQGTDLHCTEPSFETFDTGGLKLSGTTGTATISAAGDIRISAGGGNVTNRNGAILAGGSIAITTTGTVSNIADLLVNATVSGDQVTGTSNSFMPNAPTLIQAGGTVSIQAGAFENILNNRIRPDSFPALVPIEHAGASSPANGAPQTGSTGNGASSSTRGTNLGSAGNAQIGGGSASSSGAGGSASGNYATSSRSSGSAGKASISVGSGGSAALAQRTETDSAGEGNAVGTLTGATALARDGGTSGPATIGGVGNVDGGVTKTGFVTGTLEEAGVDPGSGNAGASIGNGNAGSVSLTIDGGSRTNAEKSSNGPVGSGGTSITRQSEVSFVSDDVAGTGPASIDAASAAAGGVTAAGFVSGALESTGIGGGSGTTVAAASDVGTANGGANLAGTSGGTPRSTGLVSGFNGAGLPGIGNQSFSAFLGTFLTGLNLMGAKGGTGFASNGSLFTYQDNTDSAYLFTTSAALSSEAALYDSSYFFDELNVDRSTTYTRLGDGLFEAMLVTKEVQAATGQAQLSEYGSALDQYQGLLKNAADAQDELGLSLGMALTDGQVAQLTTPILWYVSTTVDGHDVLVPVLYLSSSDQKAISGGALVGGTNVLISANGGITNSGTIKANEIAALAANGGDLVNASGGVIVGGSVIASAAQDIVLQGGSTITANGAGAYTLANGTSVTGGVASLTAGRDIVSSTIATNSGTGGTTHIDDTHFSMTSTMTQGVSGAAVNAASSLQLSAGNDITLNAAQLSSGGSASLIAGNDVTLGGTAATSTTTTAEYTGKHTYSISTSTQETYTGTTVTAAGPVQIGALGGSLSITGGSISTTDQAAGTIALYGAQGIDISAGQESATLNQFEQTGKRSNVTTTAASTTNSLATIDAAGGLSISTPGALVINGGSLTSGDALTVTAGSVAVNGVIDTVDSDVSTWKKKKGFVSSKTTTTTTSATDETVVGSVLSGDSLAISTPGAVTINGSAIVASGGLDISAGGPISIGTLAENDTLSQTVKVKKSGISLGSGGLFVGVGKVKTTLDTADTTSVGSLVGTTGGDLSIVSGDKLSITGSQIAAGGDVLLAGKSIDITNALDISDSTQTTKSSSFGLIIGVSSQLLQSGGNLVDAAKIASTTENDRVTAVAGLAGGMAAVNTYNAGKDALSALDSGDLSKLGVITATLGISKSTSTNTSHDETVIGSSITGNNVVLAATGAEEQGSIGIAGSSITAANDLSLAANGLITIAAAQEADTQGGKSKSSGFSVSASTDLTVSAAGNMGKSNFAGTDVQNVESTLAAGGTTTLTTPGLLTIDGSTVSGDKVVIDAGSLAVASRQDTSTYDSANKSTGVGISYNFGSQQVGVNASYVAGKQNGDYSSVAEQAGIYAGSQGFDITVTGNTDLKGAVIASEADASRNSLTTGTLTASDIENREKYSASQVSLSGGLTFDTKNTSKSGDTAPGASGGADGKGTVTPNGATPLPGVQIADGVSLTPSVPTALSASGSQQGVTSSAIAPGTIKITSGDVASQAAADAISRETAGANSGTLTQEFTDDKREEIAQGFEAAQILTTETQAFLASQAKKADKWAEENKGRDPRDNPFATWGAGGTGQLVLTALLGAAGANVTGSLESLVQSAAVNVLQGLTVEKVKAIADSFTTEYDDKNNQIPNVASEMVRTALQALTACAGNTASGSGDCSGAAMGAAASVVLNNLLSTGTTNATDADGKSLSQEQQQARENLVATIVAGFATASGLDANAAVTAAQNETENNSIVPVTGALGVTRNVCTANEPECNNALPFNKWALADENSSERKEYEEVRALLGPDRDEQDAIDVLETVYWGQVPLRDAVEYVERGHNWSEAAALWEVNKSLGANGVFSPLNTDNWQAYSLASGDTLTSLLGTVPGMRMADLLAANPTIDPNNIQAGQVIHLPTQDFIESVNAAKLGFVRLEHYLEQTGGVIGQNVELTNLPAFAGEEQAVAQINALPDKIAADWIAIKATGTTSNQIIAAVKALQTAPVAVQADAGTIASDTGAAALPAPSAPVVPDGYTAVPNDNGSWTVTGPKDGPYQSTGLYDPNTGLPIFKTNNGGYVTLAEGNTSVASPYVTNGGSTIAQNYSNGTAFQTDASQAAGIAKNTKTFNIANASGGATATIPDGFDATPGGSGVTEIKSDAYLTSSSQLTAQMKLATDNNLPFNLIVSPNTMVSGSLQNAIAALPSGGSIKVYNPKTGTIIPFEGNP